MDHQNMPGDADIVVDESAPIVLSAESSKGPGLPSNLSFTRSIEVSAGRLYAVTPTGLAPIKVEQRTVMGAVGAYNNGYDNKRQPLDLEAGKQRAEIEKPNPKHIDYAELPHDRDRLALVYSLAFIGRGLAPDACNSESFSDRLKTLVAEAKTVGVYRDLAGRYLWRVVVGAPLWRNGYGDGKTVTILDKSTGVTFVFNSDGLPLDRFPGVEALASKLAVAAGPEPDPVEERIGGLIEKIANALSGAIPIARFHVTTEINLFDGAEVFPSQEFVENNKRDGIEIARWLSSENAKLPDGTVIRHATVHPQKVGNALRTIDEWHGKARFGAISVESYGWVQKEQKALRKPTDGTDLYSHLIGLDGIVEGLKADGAASKEKDRARFLVASLIRGGVYQMAVKEDKAAAEGTPKPTKGGTKGKSDKAKA